MTVVRERLRAWLAGQLGAGAEPQVSDLSSPSANGMSSETLLFEATWNEDGAARAASFVARVEPDTGDVPVFPVYDLESQFRVLNLVAEHSDVPVPRVRWLETDPAPLGAPFFVMDRVDGRVPPDVMPYTIESWLLDATPAQQRALQDASVGLLVSLHGIDVGTVDASFLELDVPGDTPLRRHFENQRRYFDFVQEGKSFAVIERAFAWLEENWPQREGEAVISWGDSRIGNVMYDGFAPAAVLDWEMAAIGPREIDLGWMIFLHIFFQEITEKMGMKGMPEFMRRADVVAEYERRSGYAPRDMDFYEVYAALRHAIVMARVHARSVHFNGAAWPSDADDVIYHKEVLDRMLRGDFRS